MGLGEAYRLGGGEIFKSSYGEQVANGWDSSLQTELTPWDAK